MFHNFLFYINTHIKIFQRPVVRRTSAFFICQPAKTEGHQHKRRREKKITDETIANDIILL